MAKEIFNPDWHYTKKEVNAFVEKVEAKQITQKELSQLKEFISKDIRLANEIYLSRDFEKKVIQDFIKQLKWKRKDLFNQLIDYKLVSVDWKLLEPWSGSKGVKFIQLILEALWFKWLNWKSLTVDWAFWPNTAWALLQYQLNSRVYKNTSLNDVITYMAGQWYNFDVKDLWDNLDVKWKPDAIANGRTLYAMMQDLLNEKVSFNKDKKNKGKIEVSTNQRQTGQNTLESIEVKYLVDEVWYVENGRYYIIWKNWEPRLINFNAISPEIKEKLKDYKVILTQIDSLLFVIDAFKEKYKNDKNKLRMLEQFEKNIKEINLFDKEARKKIVDIVNELADKVDYRFEYVKNLLFNNINYKSAEDIEYNALWFIREKLGESNVVSRKIVNDYFYLTGINEKEIWDITSFIISWKTEKAKQELKNLLKGILNKDDVEKLIQEVYELERKLLDYKENHIEELKKQAEKLWYDFDDYEVILNNIFIANSLKFLIFKYWLKEKVGVGWYIQKEHLADLVRTDKLDTLWNHKKVLELYSDIEGLGWLNPSDKNLDLFGDILQTALIELAAFGAAAVGAEAVAAWLTWMNVARWTRRGVEVIEDINKLGRAERIFDVVEVGWKFYRVGKLEKLWYNLIRLWVKGATFYEIANAIQNKIEWRNIFEGAGDLKEIGKTILMFAVFEGLGKLIEQIPTLKVKEWENLLKKSFKVSSQILIEGIALGWVWGGIDVVLGEWEWNTEMFIEWIIMAALLRLTGHISNKIMLKIEWDKIKIFDITKPIDKVLEWSSKIVDKWKQTFTKWKEKVINWAKKVKDKVISKWLKKREVKEKVEKERQFLSRLSENKENLTKKRIEEIKKQIDRTEKEIKELDKFEDLVNLYRKDVLTDETDLKELELLSRRYNIDYKSEKVLDKIKAKKQKLEITKKQLQSRLEKSTKIKERLEKFENKYKKLLELKKLQEEIGSWKYTESDIWKLIKLRKELWLKEDVDYSKRLDNLLLETKKKIDMYKKLIENI